MEKILLILLLITGILHSTERRLIVYYPKWSVDHPRYPLEIQDIPKDLVTDFVYAFVDVDKEGNISLNDDEKKQLGDLLKWKEEARANGVDVRTIFSVGGWGEGSKPLPHLAAHQESRVRFAKEARQCCQNYHFDGVDIDWEFPEDQEAGKNFLLLIQDLHTELKSLQEHSYLITIAAPAIPEDYKQIDWKEVAPLVDRISVMTYDLHGPWKGPEDLVTNHQCALRPTTIGSPELNTTAILTYYSHFVPKEKLAVGIPLFFTAYDGVRGGILPSHYGSPYSGPAKNPYVPYEKGELYYRDIVEDVQAKRAQGYWDPSAIAYMAYYPKTAVFASGVNEEAIRKICQFIIDQGFQGAKIWNFQGDTPDWQALRLMHKLLIESVSAEVR